MRACVSARPRGVARYAAGERVRALAGGVGEMRLALLALPPLFQESVSMSC